MLSSIFSSASFSDEASVVRISAPFSLSADSCDCISLRRFASPFPSLRYALYFFALFSYRIKHALYPDMLFVSSLMTFDTSLISALLS